MPVKGGYLLIAGGGAVLLWSGLRGKRYSDVIRSLVSGQNPATLPNANPILSGSTPALASTTSAVTSSSGGGTTPGAAGAMLGFMMSQVGHPYLSQNPQRFGPQYWDCSGLVYGAAHHAGINLPQSQAIADLEAIWFAAHGWSVQSLNRSQILAGDLLFFTGAHPDANFEFPPIGHVGMASSPTEYVSAYDTASGVVNKSIDSGLVVRLRQK